MAFWIRVFSGGAVFDVAFHLLTARGFVPSSLALWFGPFSFLSMLLYICYCTFIYPEYFSPYIGLPYPPGAHPLFGNFVDYGKHYYEHGLVMAEKYPDLHFTRFKGSFGMDVVSLLTAEAHRVVLQTYSYDCPKPTLAQAFKVVIGNGIVFAEGEEHKTQRKLLTPAFANAHVRKFVPIFMEKTQEVMNLFDDIVRDGPTIFPVFKYFSRLTLDTIGLASFGVDFNAVGDEDNELVTAYERVAGAGKDFFPFNMYALVPGWKFVPTDYNRNLSRSRKIFRSAVAKVFEQRQKVTAADHKTVEEKEDAEYVQKNRDILSIMLESDESTWSGHDVENQIMVFLFAGHETTAGALAWAMLTLAKHPDVQEKLRAEVRASFPGGLQDIKTAEQIESLKYLDNVTRELFRVNPPVLTGLREAQRDITIGDQTIYKGTGVQLCLKAMNYDPRLWGPDAAEFNPDRWNGNQASNAFAYLTFLQGPRSCIGKRFAEIEFRCILAAFVARYKFEESVENQPIHREFVVTVRPTDGLPMKVSRVEGW
ncbi:cytochrome P450 [Myxozyma melibiosi]|uniref:Cytochrome P450 n=1 Tax=Myxozyma melibiosi TaxID=54550 RepID=A0ABR1FB39_9ASCO